MRAIHGAAEAAPYHIPGIRFIADLAIDRICSSRLLSTHGSGAGAIRVATIVPSKQPAGRQSVPDPIVRVRIVPE